jgi:hypothetical protein
MATQASSIIFDHVTGIGAQIFSVGQFGLPAVQIGLSQSVGCLLKWQQKLSSRHK